MSAATFWANAKANYWAGRKQDVLNIYDTATNMGTPRASYNRAATVIGPVRQGLEKGYAANWQTYQRMRAWENRPGPPEAPGNAPIYSDIYNKLWEQAVASGFIDKEEKAAAQYYITPSAQAEFYKQYTKWSKRYEAYYGVPPT